MFPGPQKSSRSSSPDVATGASAAGDAFFSSRRCLAGRVQALQGARYLVRWTVRSKKAVAIMLEARPQSVVHTHLLHVPHALLCCADCRSMIC